jgi:hypothetical protein
MTKRLGKIVAKGLVLLVLFFLIIRALEPLFNESNTSVWDHFYAQEKNTVDILISGNSHANAGIDQDIVEAKLRSNVVSLATRSQNIYQSYFCALEAYQYQTPKVLIIENYLFYERLTLDEFVNQDPTNNDYLKRYLTFEGKKLGTVKYDETRKFCKGNLVENMFVTLKKHHRWRDIEEIKERLYKKDSTYRNRSIFPMSSNTAEDYRLKNKYNLMAFNVMEDEENALQSIIKLAREEGTEQIILVTVPFYKPYREKINYNALTSPFKNFAEKNLDIEYIDLNIKFANWDNTYFTNESVSHNQHLNYKGAIKVSNALSNFNKAKFNSKYNRSLEYYLYRKIQKDTLNNGDRMLGNLERLNGEKRASLVIEKPHTQINLKGWMAAGNNSSDANEMFVGLKKDKDFIYISDSRQIQRKERKDVSKYFDKTNIYDHSGFRFSINRDILEKGTLKPS